MGMASLRIILGCAAALAALLLSGLSPVGAAAETIEAFPITKVIVETSRGQTVFTAELADTDQRRIQGLQGRRTLAADAGMLFHFGHRRPVSMWMKNTYIPLDMIFADSDGTIIGIARDTVPLSLELISSPGPAAAVLEVNAGTAERLQLRPGDRLRHPLFDQR
jgi:hypothetical protein